MLFFFPLVQFKMSDEIQYDLSTASDHVIIPSNVMGLAGVVSASAHLDHEYEL